MGRTLIGLALLLASAPVLAGSPRALAGDELVEQIRSHEGGIGPWWVGNAGRLVK